MQGYNAGSVKQDLPAVHSYYAGFAFGGDLQNGEKASDECVIKIVIFAGYGKD